MQVRVVPLIFSQNCNPLQKSGTALEVLKNA